MYFMLHYNNEHLSSNWPFSNHDKIKTIIELLDYKQQMWVIRMVNFLHDQKSGYKKWLCFSGKG